MKVVVKLIKCNIPADKIIKNDRKIRAEVIDNVGTFYYKISKTVKPEWVEDFFCGRLNCADKLRVASAAGMLLVTRIYDNTERIFAITFGSGRYILQDNVTEERFGLKIAVNSIQHDSLRSIDFNKMDGVPSIVRNQVSRLTKIENFNIDTQSNLLKSITGSLPIDRQEDIGTSMTGSDSLAINSNMTVNNLMEKLDQLYALYQSDAYKRHFAWVDNITAIADNGLVTQLETELFSRINSRTLANIWMSLPTIVDWSIIHHIKYSGRTNQQYDDVCIESALAELYDQRNDITPVEFKGSKVKAFDDNGAKYKEWPLFKCLNAEIVINNNLYVLNDGCWYQVDRNYYDMINRVCNSVKSSTVQFLDWVPRIDGDKEKFELEKEYNIRLADSDDNFCNMDRDLIYPNGNQDKIEFCDVLGRDGVIIHVKRNGGSELIGHLLNQGLVSATLLLTEELRRKLNAKLNESGRGSWCVPEHDFNAGGYSIVYGIMCANDELKIHFFSKVVMKDIVTTLRNYGFKVYLNKITKAQQQ